MPSPITMRSWITLASLLFLLCGLVLSTAAPDKVDASAAKAVLRKLHSASPIHSRSELLEARAPKRGDSSGFGGSSSDDDEDDDDDDTFDFLDDDDDDDNIFDDSDTCFDTSCEACWGEGYTECSSDSTWCYNPDLNSADVACPAASDSDSSAARLFNSQSSVSGLVLGSLGLAAVLL